jgi:hypothetical protein
VVEFLDLASYMPCRVIGMTEFGKRGEILLLGHVRCFRRGSFYSCPVDKTQLCYLVVILVVATTQLDLTLPVSWRHQPYLGQGKSL